MRWTLSMRSDVSGCALCNLNHRSYQKKLAACVSGVCCKMRKMVGSVESHSKSGMTGMKRFRRAAGLPSFAAALSEAAEHGHPPASGELFSPALRDNS